ncbi:MAG: caspase family protein, partial [Planctomycetes bacterium]|nr:caspase family protein [Planctomycetota bacterium]
MTESEGVFHSFFSQNREVVEEEGIQPDVSSPQYPRPEVLLSEPFAFGNEVIRTEDDHLVVRGTVQAPGMAEGLQILVNQQLVVNRPFSGERRNQVFMEKVPLALGENNLRIVSWDCEKQVSQETVLQVFRKTGMGDLYVLAVGINDYEDPEIPNLCFAENDAARFEAFFAGHPKSPCKMENVRCLTGKEVNRANFLRAIDEHLVRQATDENDMAILLFSGHGFSDGAGGYYLATQET